MLIHRGLRESARDRLGARERARGSTRSRDRVGTRSKGLGTRSRGRDW